MSGKGDSNLEIIKHYLAAPLIRRSELSRNYLAFIGKELGKSQTVVSALLRMSKSVYHYIKTSRTSFGINKILEIDNLSAEKGFTSFSRFLTEQEGGENE